VTADGRGVVSHAGTRLLADVADACGVSAALSDALGGMRKRRSGHDPGRVLTDVAVMLADGGEAISDLAVLRDQSDMFGPVASTATAWRVLDAVDDTTLADIRDARTSARERAWLLREEAGRGLPTSTAGGRSWPGLVLDVDATLVDCHSEKESAAPTFKGGFGFHPILVWLDNTNEALAGLLRPGNAGANTAADHIAVVELAVAQIPDTVRYGTPILIRADGAGCSRQTLAHIRSLREAHGLQVEFSVGFTMTERVQDAILALPEHAWTAAVDADGEIRDGADVAELTGMLPDLAGTGWPDGMRVIVRRERPHPGAQLTFSDVHGYRFQAFATDTPAGQLAHLEARHRAHARVEDRIRNAKQTGLGRFPSRQLNINAAWLELSLLACDLIAWTQTTLLDGDLARCEPKALRYKLLHVAARITHGQRRIWLRIACHWPWRHELATAFARLATLPRPLRV
jgi:Transposase DDE domain group 1